MKYQYVILQFEEQKENKLEKNEQFRTYGIISEVMTQHNWSFRRRGSQKRGGGRGESVMAVENVKEQNPSQRQ